ncbi:MAG: hypothetical protein JWQ01_3293 [Massilia sp.]|nr:hypothetical protein [Massilia sp.]
MDPRLSEWATPTDQKYIDAINLHGSGGKAAMAMGVTKSAVNEAMVRPKKRAALKGYSPEHAMVRTVPDGFKVRGVSTLYDKEGKLAAQWVKSSADDERREQMIREFVAELCAEAKGLAPTVPAPAFVNSDLLTVNPIGDHHHGMYADPSETGDAYDAKISVHRLESAFDHLIP